MTAPEESEDVPTATELARHLADSLGRLAGLLRDPRARDSTATIAEGLDELAKDASLIAEVLAGQEEAAPQLRPDIEPCAEQERRAADILGEAGAAALSGPFGPANAGAAMAEGEPLEWGMIPEAVERLGRLAASPCMDEAGLADRIEIARDAAAARRLQRTVAPLAELFRRFALAGQLHRERSGNSPSIQATGALALAVFDFANAFADLKKAGAAHPAFALSALLDDAQRGTRRPIFCDAGAVIDRRSTPFKEARTMGEAAIALDARHRAAPETRLSVIAADVAAMLSASTGEHVAGSQVQGWRDRCMKADRGDPKGFKGNHPALDAWRTYQAELVGEPAQAQSRSPEWWAHLAALYEGHWTASTPARPQNTDREKVRFPSRAPRVHR